MQILNSQDSNFASSLEKLINQPRVNNEDVIDDLEGQVRRMLDFCGLKFQESCLNFHQTKRNVRTPSAEQVRQPISRSGVDNWKPFEEFLTPLKESLGTEILNSSIGI